MVLSLKQKRISENFVSLYLTVTFKFGFGEISRDFVWTDEDVDALAEQIESIPETPAFGSFATFEPEVSMFYFNPAVEFYDDLEEEFHLYINMDSGIFNKNISTDTGPSLKLVTNKKTLLQWIQEVQKEFLDK